MRKYSFTLLSLAGSCDLDLSFFWTKSICICLPLIFYPRSHCIFRADIIDFSCSSSYILGVESTGQVAVWADENEQVGV